jgi:hypothetical protein
MALSACARASLCVSWLCCVCVCVHVCVRCVCSPVQAKWVKMAEELKVVETDRFASAVAAAPPRRKRPPSSYMLWMNEQGREYTKSQYPDLKATEIVSFCGRFWREMPPEEKRRWQQKATQMKEAYERGE